MPDETVSTPTNEPTFGDFLETAITNAGLSLPEGAQVGAPIANRPPAAAAAAPAAAVVPPAAVVAPAFVVPDAITAKLAGVVPPEPPAAAASDPAAAAAARDAELDTLFKTKAGQAFSEIKGDLKTTRAQLAEIQQKHQTELADYKTKLEAASKVNPAEVETLKAQVAETAKINQEYERELSLAKVEATREYKETVVAKQNAIATAAGEIAKRGAGLTEAAVLAAVRETDPARQEELLAAVTASLPERDRLKLYSLIEQHGQVAAADAVVRGNAKQALEMLQQRRTEELARLDASETAAYAQALDHSWKELSGVFPFLNPIEGNEGWNNMLASVNKEARAVNVGKMSPQDRAQLTYQGYVLPVVAEVTKSYAQEIVALRAKIAQYERATPGAGGGARPGAATISAAATAAAKDGVGFLDAIELAVR